LLSLAGELVGIRVIVVVVNSDYVLASDVLDLCHRLGSVLIPLAKSWLLIMVRVRRVTWDTQRLF
jgi:hypothetical protein